jgi:hypothetical protein
VQEEERGLGCSVEMRKQEQLLIIQKEATHPEAISHDNKAAINIIIAQSSYKVKLW